MSIQSNAYVFELLLPFQNQKLFISGRVIIKNKAPARLLEMFATTFPCQALKQPWKLMAVAGIPAALGVCGGQQRCGKGTKPCSHWEFGASPVAPPLPPLPRAAQGN